MTERLEGTALARHELDRAIRARVPMIGIETPEETRVLGVVQALAAHDTIGISGDVEVGPRTVFQWTNTNGIVRLGTTPKCGRCESKTEQRKNDDGVAVYACQSCGEEVPTEFPQGTEDPSFAIQDFIDYAVGEGDKDSYLEQASILVLCDIHRFTTNEFGENPTRTLRALRDLAGKLAPTKSGVVLLAPHLGDLGDAERHVHRIPWPLPTIEELTAMIHAAGQKMEGRITVDLNGGTEDLAAALAALTMEEAARVLKLAIVDEKRLDGDMAPALMAQKAKVLQQAAGIKVRTPRFDLADVGGLDLVKAEIERLPRYLSNAAKAANVRAPRGFLFGGPPGTGKSLLAEAMAAAANVPLMEWNLGESKSKWVGESERQVADVLRAADAIGRCVLWIDEGEKQMGSGGEDSHEVTESIMGAVLKWMQDRDSDVIVAMTVNHPERLRSEMLSRFDSKWFVDYPQAKACAAIIDIHTRRRGLTYEPSQMLGMGREAAKSNLCGREIEHVIEQEMRTAFVDGMNLDAIYLTSALHKAKGLASQPSRARAIQDMKSECAGQFRPAAEYAKAEVVTQERHDGAMDIEV